MDGGCTYEASPALMQVIVCAYQSIRLLKCLLHGRNQQRVRLKMRQTCQVLIALSFLIGLTPTISAKNPLMTFMSASISSVSSYNFPTRTVFLVTSTTAIARGIPVALAM